MMRVATAVVVFLGLVDLARAHVDPLACNGNSLHIQINASSSVHVWSWVPYKVIYDNQNVQNFVPCNATGVSATFKLPDGTVITTLSNQTLNVGTQIECPGDVR